MRSYTLNKEKGNRKKSWIGGFEKKLCIGTEMMVELSNTKKILSSDLSTVFCHKNKIKEVYH